ncbi:MAG: hypothetical protein AB7V42_12265 [Thermoleophilia bacterium]
MKQAAAERTQSFKSFENVTTAARFAPGVTYGEALRALFITETTGEAPLSFDIVNAPRGKAVLTQPTGGQEGITVWLGAPTGYTAEWGANAYGLTPTGGGDPSDTGQSDAGPWPAGTSLGVPVLPACQVSVSVDLPPVKACGNEDMPLLDTDASTPIPLP